MFINLFKKSNDTTAHMTINNRVFIPGIRPKVPVLLVTPIKGQHFARATIVTATNPEFTKVYSEKFLAVTKDFMALSHKEQLAELMWCWLDYNTSLVDLINTSELDGRLDSVDVHLDYELDGESLRVINTDTEAIDKLCVIAGLVGKRAALSVANYHAHCIRTTARNLIGERTKAAKKAGARPVSYERKAFNLVKKENKKINKAVAKRSKAEGKDMLKAELEARGAEKKAAKAAKKAVNDITADIEDIIGDEVTGAEANPA